MELEEITRQAAQSLNLSPTDNEIEARMKTRLGLRPEDSRETFANALRSELRVTGLSISDTREIAASEAAEDKIRQQLKTQVPAQAEQVDAAIIRTSTREKIDQARQRLVAGEPFVVVALELSEDTTKAAGGEIGWTPRGALPAQVDTAAFALAPQTNSDVVETEGNFYLIRSRGREVRDVTDEQSANVVNRQLSDLLSKTRTELITTPKLTSDQLNRILRALPANV
jgi:peptidyl-prolyl cis-trans isomerase C